MPIPNGIGIFFVLQFPKKETRKLTDAGRAAGR